MIETRVIDGADVYGVPQDEYVLDGKAGHDYTDALAAAAFRQSTAVEADLTAMGAVVRARQTKLNELDVAMCTIAYAIGTLPDPNHGDSSDLSDKIDALMDARDVARKYGITISLAGDSGNQIKRAEAQTASANLQHEMDLESNALQQDNVSLQNMISKRDSTYQTAMSVVKKSLNVTKTLVKALGN
jgi:hypothetical protein